MKDPDFLEEIVDRVSSAYDPPEVVSMMELSLYDIAKAFETEFLDLAFNLGFISSHGDDYDTDEDSIY